MEALKEAGGADVIRIFPRDLHFEQQLHPEWVNRRGLWDGFPSSLKFDPKKTGYLLQQF